MLCAEDSAANQSLVLPAEMQAPPCTDRQFGNYACCKNKCMGSFFQYNFVNTHEIYVTFTQMKKKEIFLSPFRDTVPLCCVHWPAFGCSRKLKSSEYNAVSLYVIKKEVEVGPRVLPDGATRKWLLNVKER